MIKKVDQVFYGWSRFSPALEYNDWLLTIFIYMKIVCDLLWSNLFDFNFMDTDLRISIINMSQLVNVFLQPYYHGHVDWMYFPWSNVHKAGHIYHMLFKDVYIVLLTMCI